MSICWYEVMEGGRRSKDVFAEKKDYHTFLVDSDVSSYRKGRLRGGTLKEVGKIFDRLTLYKEKSK